MKNKYVSTMFCSFYSTIPNQGHPRDLDGN